MSIRQTDATPIGGWRRALAITVIALVLGTTGFLSVSASQAKAHANRGVFSGLHTPEAALNLCGQAGREPGVCNHAGYVTLPLVLTRIPAPRPAPRHIAPQHSAPVARTAPVVKQIAPAPKPSGSSGSGGVSGADNSGEPCHSHVYVDGPIWQWAIPPGCYAGIYYPNPKNYVYRAGFGWCNWWPEVLHPNNPRILFAPRHTRPIPGAAVYFAPGVQGAGSAGHYAEVVAVLSGGWVLISEMNDVWRGGGWGRVNYRYIRVESGVWFLY